MTKAIASILEDAIAALRRAPHVVVEAAVVRASPAPDAWRQLQASGTSLPAWVAELHAQIGGAHLSWRLSTGGYEQLEPERTDAEHRYDISGNLDLLALDELAGGLTGYGWQRIYGDRAHGYRPVDFASYHLNLGFAAPEGGPVIFDLVEGRRAPLAMTLPAYLEAGAALWFLDGWQLSLLGDAEAERQGRRLAELVRRLSGG
jgi:hypothetical protein